MFLTIFIFKNFFWSLWRGCHKPFDMLWTIHRVQWGTGSSRCRLYISDFYIQSTTYPLWKVLCDVFHIDIWNELHANKPIDGFYHIYAAYYTKFRTQTCTIQHYIAIKIEIPNFFYIFDVNFTLANIRRVASRVWCA